MTDGIDDVERLMAYADGALPPAEATAVAQRLRTDAEARRLVATFMQQPALLRAAFAPETAGRPTGRPPVAANGNRRRMWRTAAAAILLVGGAAAGWGAAGFRHDAAAGNRTALMQMVVDAQRLALNAALERNSNGEAGQWSSANGAAHGTITPVLTFVDTEGSFCREVEQAFTIDGTAQAAYGLACRVGEGDWQVRYWLFENPSTLPAVQL